MANKNCCPPPKQPPFPAMSAHFAHTLDDMSEQYLQAQYIELADTTGTLNADDLKKLTDSRTNMLVYNERVFRFADKKDNIYTYLTFYLDEDGTTYKAQKTLINIITGEWEISDIDTGSGSEQKIEILENKVTDIQNNLTEVQNKLETAQTNITQLTENVTEITNKLETEITERKETDEKLSQQISDMESWFEGIDESLNTLKEDVDKNSEDIKSLESGFETVDEALEQIDVSITNINSKMENIGDDLIMNGGEIE